jgi:hypothetical protein
MPKVDHCIGLYLQYTLTHLVNYGLECTKNLLNVRKAYLLPMD